MPYATEIDIVERYSQDTLTLVSDRDRDGTSDVGVVDRALNDATAEIDSFISEVYQLPLAVPVPELLTFWCVDIAIYRMAADCAIATKQQRERYDDALVALREVRSGKRGLGIPQEPPALSNSGAVFVAGPRKASRDLLSGF